MFFVLVAWLAGPVGVLIVDRSDRSNPVRLAEAVTLVCLRDSAC